MGEQFADAPSRHMLNDKNGLSTTHHALYPNLKPSRSASIQRHSNKDSDGKIKQSANDWQMHLHCTSFYKKTKNVGSTHTH